MSDVSTGYALTVLACKLGLYPSGVEGNTEDGFRYTDSETGYSIEWEPHRNVQQARVVFCDLLPQYGWMVSTFRFSPSMKAATFEGWCMISQQDSTRDEQYIYWGRETKRTEAEALLQASCLAVQALRRL